MRVRSVPSNIEDLNQEIVACRKCPRLVEWREAIARDRRRSYQDWDYWGKPVPNFGDPNANRLIVGLAPAAHGGNRTGRMFTGDRSGEWLFGALHRAGVANQGHSDFLDDGLSLQGVMITAPVHCAPPANKPTPEEFAACAPYLDRLFRSRHWKSILCLGRLGWLSALRALGVRGRPRFGHGTQFRTPEGTLLVGCYHPSQQNTFTGKLTQAMLDEAVAAFLETVSNTFP